MQTSDPIIELLQKQLQSTLEQICILQKQLAVLQSVPEKSISAQLEIGTHYQLY